ncbi:hypothetical protein [Aliamphritea spongicola]|uniref:hypothetical protein n=1 Tax=Aliamphritea spongicola TaxID=707589 RepID=UPI00196A32B6|nr:hypothetical protein [Aliamphritea spongicola]MBN3563004.1 hypothetical protein [Aliamphritea spongicola]
MTDELTDELKDEPGNTDLDSRLIGAGHTTGRLLLFAELTPIIALPALPVNLIIYIEAMRNSVSQSYSDNHCNRKIKIHKALLSETQVHPFIGGKRFPDSD